MDKSGNIKHYVRRLSIEMKLRKDWHSVYYFFYTTFIHAPSFIRILLKYFSEIVHWFSKTDSFLIILEFLLCLVYYQIRVLAWYKKAVAEIIW